MNTNTDLSSFVDRYDRAVEIVDEIVNDDTLDRETRIEQLETLIYGITDRMLDVVWEEVV